MSSTPIDASVNFTVTIAALLNISKIVRARKRTSKNYSSAIFSKTSTLISRFMIYHYQQIRNTKIAKKKKIQ